MKKQEELEKKAQELERRERELQSHGLGPGACKSGGMKVGGCRDGDFQASLFDFNYETTESGYGTIRIQMRATDMRGGGWNKSEYK